jgi:uncharacterized protein (DUF433 family)
LSLGIAVKTAMQSSLIVSDKDVLSGAPVFFGTRVPARSLIDYLEAGETIDTFLTDFPTVSRAQVMAYLEAADAALSKALV